MQNRNTSKVGIRLYPEMMRVGGCRWPSVTLVLKEMVGRYKVTEAQS